MFRGPGIERPTGLSGRMPSNSLSKSPSFGNSRKGSYFRRGNSDDDTYVLTFQIPERTKNLLAQRDRRRYERTVEYEKQLRAQSESRKVYEGATPPDNESARLAALQKRNILDTDFDENFDRLTRLAVKLFNTKIALVSLIDEHRQWFKSVVGLDARYTCRNVAFCSFAIKQDDVMVIPDATKDPRFAKNPLVVGAPHIRFYAGAPLISTDGFKLGTFCVIDYQPRHDFDEGMKAQLTDLAHIVVHEMELYRNNMRALKSNEHQQIVSVMCHQTLMLHTMDQLYETNCIRIAEVMNVDFVAMIEFTRDSSSSILQGSFGFDPAKVQAASSNPPSSLSSTPRNSLGGGSSTGGLTGLGGLMGAAGVNRSPANRSPAVTPRNRGSSVDMSAISEDSMEVTPLSPPLRSTTLSPVSRLSLDKSPSTRAGLVPTLKPPMEEPNIHMPRDPMEDIANLDIKPSSSNNGGVTYVNMSSIINHFLDNAMNYHAGEPQVLVIDSVQDMLNNNDDSVSVLSSLPKLLESHGVQSAIIVMVYSHEKPFGLIGVFDEYAHGWKDEDVNFLSSCAKSISVLIERTQHSMELATERKRTEDLLYNVLPHPISQRLKAFETPIADSFSNATVLFADIVNFTEVSAKVAPRDLVGFLNRVFSAFDVIVMRRHLNKIKTIGDCYMVVGGIFGQEDDHTDQVLDFGLEILEELENIKAEYSYHEQFSKMSLRVGVHSGPLVAGVIGLINYLYDVWGDTVNVASRLESTGNPGRVHITESTKELIVSKVYYLTLLTVFRTIVIICFPSYRRIILSSPGGKCT
eukprot:TRINITY_DN5117_c0_g2_i3.p1 TRINITY_DN5117_c0_g2~~TRINITY_DN5117_c0_g2_i3.p1  ORF type:complete len:804 (+),score=172.85 TRINITY_DN5117_c0_g2_i3:132-2543(+)